MMFKKEMKSLCIGKSLLCLLAMFLMLLASQAAWAEDYALSIAGKQYTAEQLSALQSAIALTSSDCAGIKSGTVTLTPASGQDPVKLTLNNAELSGDNNIVSSIDLTVDFVGSSSITLPVNTTIYVFEGNGTAKLHFTNTGKTTNPLTIMFGSGLMNNWGEGSDVISDSSDPSNDWWLNSNTNTSEERILHWNKKYDLWIGETQVCYFGREDVLDNQKKVSFDVNSITLNLNNVTLESDITTKLDNLTISLADENTLTGSIKYTGDNSNSSLTFNANLEYANNAKITLSTSNQDIGVISGFKTVQVNSPLETTYTNWGNDVKAATIEAQCYKIRVGGVLVTEANKGNVLGTPDGTDPTVSFEPAGDAPATLTLHDATINVNDGEEYGVKYWDTTALNIKLIGTNNINTQYNCEPILYDGESDNKPTLTFKSGSIPCSLHLETSGYTSVIKYFDNVLGVNGIDNATGGNLYIISDNQLHYNSTTGLYTGENSNVASATITSGYGLLVGDVLVHNGNATNVLGDQSDNHQVIFEAGTNTLTLNNASLTAPIKSNLDNLTIKLKGNNSIVETSDSATLINSYKKTATLSFDVDNELGGSLTLTNRGDGATIKNFTSVSLAEELYIHSNQAGLRYETINNEKCYVAQQYGESWTMTINKNASYPIWVYKNSTDGYVQVTESNKANILGEQAETNSVTYNGGTLTLNGATINSGSSYAFVMGDDMTALNVVLVGENTVTGNGFQFTTSSPSLTFKTNGTAAGSLAIAEGDFVLASTGTTINYQNGLVYDAETKTVGALSAPTISSILNGLTGERTVEIQGQSQGTVKYSLTYADSKLSTNNVSNQEYSAAFPLLGPATIKATVTVGEVVSPEATAYYFGILPNPLKFVYDGVTAPEFSATLYPEVANVTFTPSGSPGDFVTLSDGNMTITGFGSGKASADINAPVMRNFTVLTDTIGFMMEVVPSAPTIAFDGTKTYLNSDKVTISLPTSLTGNQNATIKYSWDESCEPGNGNNYTDDGVTLNAGTNTLYAWVRYNGQTADDAVYSERVSQVFTVKTDINQFAVKDMIATYPTYTGSAIVPTFTLYDANDETSTLSDENYDVRIEKYVDETTDYSVVTSVLDAGTYKVYAVGKGDTYGGEKLIYEALKVKKANIPTPTVATIDGQVYDGQAHNIITVSDVPEETTVKYYYTEIEASDYSNSSFQLLSEPGEEEFHETVPTTTYAGYFALLYRIEGGDNYEDKEAGELIKVAFLPAEITSMTLDTESLTYTGAAQTVTITVMADNLELGDDDFTVTLNGEAVTGDIQATTVGKYTVVVTGIGNFMGSKTATFNIVNRTLADNEVTFNNNWATFYSNDGVVMLPSGIGAYVAKSVDDKVVTVSQISYIPEKIPVLLNNETTTTTENTSVTDNLLVHASTDIPVSQLTGDIYGLYNGTFMRVTGTITAGKNFLQYPAATIVNPGAPQLTIVIDGETTGVNDVRSKKEDVRGDIYDLQGRKVKKPSKRGLYIQKGHKVVVNK